MAQENGLANVTVSAIIEHAHINRSTFYRHFLDKPDLIEQIETEILNQIKIQYDQNMSLNHKLVTSDGTRELKTMVSIIDQHHKMIAFLISDNGDMHFRTQLSQLFFETVGEALNHFFDRLDEKQTKLFLSYTVGAFLAIVKLWVTNYDSYSQHDIFAFLAHIRHQEINGLIAIERLMKGMDE